MLDARLAERGSLRFTPTGIAALDCMLSHRSMQPEAGGERRVECELHAVAFGDTARALNATAPQALLRCEGFLARRFRTGITLALHIERFTALKEDDGHATSHG